MIRNTKSHPISGYLVNVDGTVIINPKTGLRLTPTLAPSGYLKIGNYICSSGTVHQLVYEAFIGLVPDGLHINHKDGVKTNNNISNLEVVTPRENTIHAYQNGLARGKKGETNSGAKLESESDVLKMYDMFDEGYCNKCVSRVFNLHSGYVSLIRGGKRWRHLFTRTFQKSNKWRCSCSSATTIENTPSGGSE